MPTNEEIKVEGRYLLKVRKYIGEVEEIMDAEFGSCRSLEEMIADKTFKGKKIYSETIKRLRVIYGDNIPD